MGEIHRKEYVLDASELRAWSRILEEPIHSDCGERAPSGRELKGEPFHSEPHSLAVVERELSRQPLTQLGPGVRSRVQDEAWPAVWQDTLGKRAPSSANVFSLAEGRYLNELPEGSEPLKENCEVNQGCCDQIPALLGRATNTSSAADADICETPVQAEQSGKTGALVADDRYQDERKYRVTVETIAPVEIAHKLGRSLKWVYDHARELGGVQIGRTWIFTREGLDRAILGRGSTEMEGARKAPGSKVSPGFRHKKRSGCVGKRNSGKTSEGIGSTDDADRHGFGQFL